MGRDSEKGKYRSPGGSATWEYISTLSCSFLIFSVCCIAGWDSPTLAILMRKDGPGRLTSSDVSTLTSIASIGKTVSSIFTMVLVDKLGRKYSMMAIGIPTIISWALIAISQDTMVLLVARFIAGSALGLVLSIPIMYVGEIASVEFRGAVGMVCTTMINAGILFMYIMVPYFTVQNAAFICLSLTILAMISTCFITESPYFLAMIGKFDEAESALEKLRGKTDVSEELEEIKMSITHESETTTNCSKDKEPEPSIFIQLFTIRGNRIALYINTLFTMVLQFGSFIIIMVYGQIIFEDMKSGISAHACTIIVGILQLVCNILTTFVIDKLGRRPLVCISGLMSSTSLLVVAVYFYLMDYTKIDVTPYSMFAVCAIFTNIIALNIGLSPLQSIMQSETFDTRIKGLAISITGTGGGVLATISVKSYLTLVETWHFGNFWPFLSFSIVTFICTALILKLLPETKGKTLLEIQKALNAT